MKGNLVVLRNKLERKKPKFIRQDSHKKKKLENKWRRPKGRHSKMRTREKGHSRFASVGYGSPVEVRGLNREGIKEKIVRNVADISGVDNVIVIASNIGIKKRVLIAQKAKELKIKIGNLENVEEFLKRIDERFKKKKEIVKQKEEKKKKVKEESLKKGEKKDERKVGEEKEIKRKVLEKKQ